MGGGIMHSEQRGIVGGSSDVHYRFTVIADGLIRFEWAPDCRFEDRPSAFAANRENTWDKVPKYRVEETQDSLEISTSRFRLIYDKQPFSTHGLYALIQGHTRSLWRYGEPKDTLGGTARTLDGVNGRIDMGKGVCSRDGYATVDDSTTMLFEKDGFIAPRRPGPGRVDGYMFAYGYEYAEAVKALYHISGQTPVLPRWALGNWWSRYYEYSADSYLSLMDQFRDEKIPLAVGVLDMDWHWVDDPRVVNAGQTGWTGYSWNTDLFPDPPAFLDQLHKRKLKVTLNDHPADGVFSYEDRYPEVAKAMGVDPSTKEPIEFDITNRKYVKAYLDILIGALEKDGCDFVWIDWQQGQWCRLPGVDPLWVLNYFHFHHNQRHHDDQPLIFSRYAGPGSHRYPIGFSGDTIVSWQSLEFQPEFTATASNIGYGWWSHDIGGHMLGTRDDELYARWVQLGVLSPIMRLHSTKSLWVAKEPWKLVQPYCDVVSFFLRLRHRLIPYLQTMNVRASVRGEPLVQPIYWHYPERDEAYKVPNQYFFGTELLVVPITSPQNPSLRLAKVKAWLPPGRYVDYFNGLVYEGDRVVWLSRSLAQCPIFLKEGSIVPLDKASEPGNGAEVPEGYELIVAVGRDGSFDILVEGDKQGNEMAGTQQRTTITYTQSTGTLRIGPSSTPTGRKISGVADKSWTVRFLGIREPKSVQVTVNDVQRDQLGPNTCTNGFFVDIGTVSCSSEAVIQIGANPQFSETDPKLIIEPIVNNAQIEYRLKQSIWDIVGHMDPPYAAAIGKLQTVVMSEDLRVAISEYLI
ncbi:putative alpha-xylosidase [Xylariales sp. PMI_506]|nr:putative alpha-xylosidase [Xylariales sp. PMI_506]